MFEHELKNAYIGEYVENPQDLLSNVIAYYPMAGNLNDISGHGYNLTTLSGASYIGGTEYNTVSNFSAYNTSATYVTTQSATWSMWYNGTASVLASLGDDAGDGWGFQIRKTITYVVINRNAYNTTAVSDTSGWHMYSGVFDYTNKTLKFYIDGVLQQTKSSLPSAGLRGGTRLCLGVANSSSVPGIMDGMVGITFATQNAMSETDLTKFYNATKGRYGL